MAGVFVIACQTGTFSQLGFWSTAATVLLAALVIGSLPELNFFGMLVPLALLYAIYRQPFHWPAISVWLLLLAAVLAATGLSLLFHNACHPGKHHHSDHGDGSRRPENIDGNDIFARSSFSESCKYLHADSLQKARLSVSFGKMSVYFDQVRLSPEGAQADIDVSFGEMVLYLPRSWRVADRIYTVTGAVNSDPRQAPPDADAPTLTLAGRVSFGNLEIRYI